MQMQKRVGDLRGDGRVLNIMWPFATFPSSVKRNWCEDKSFLILLIHSATTVQTMAHTRGNMTAPPI